MSDDFSAIAGDSQAENNQQVPSVPQEATEETPEPGPEAIVLPSADLAPDGSADDEAPAAIAGSSKSRRGEGSPEKRGRRSWSASKGKQAQGTGRHWYVLHTYSGYEDAVEKALRQRIDALNMQDFIFDIKVPKESQIVIKRGEPTQEKKRIFPGYVLVDMIVTDDSWYVVRNTPNVTGFVGSGNIPVPVTPEEFGIIEKRTGSGRDPKFRIEFREGEHVAITSGPFASYDGIIDKVDPEKGKVKVLVSIFDRETPIELDFTQVKKK